MKGSGLVMKPFPNGRAKTFFWAILCVALLGGCASHLTPRSPVVREILVDPRGYDGKFVRIDGTVKMPFSFVVVKYFELYDGTGAIPVITSRPMPREGSTITVEGRVNAAFSVGVVNLVVIEEKP